MTTIEKYFAQAELAQAAYGTYSNGTSWLTGDAVKMTPAQAAKFASEWTVVNQLPDTLSGFSGTLFRGKDGQYALALRGTAGATDLMADAGDILLDGIALDQIVDMVNYQMLWRMAS
ncbi:MAG: hypothetical protein FWH15_02940 [Betaproteobacteria bacterium]|nr:hypothetical protein [Betaproteobacteria bacterium]